ncbi:hypothetical protein M0805_009709 [Coniferiporia weirii]|nr:hypothetical protein M0805_009709 [Coniferiporia weirii]
MSMLLDGRPLVPPRPYSAASVLRSGPVSGQPPVPPLPTGYRTGEANFPYSRSFDPLIAPRPQRSDPDLPAYMARTLDQRSAMATPRFATPGPSPHLRQMSSPAINYNPSFIMLNSQQSRGPPPAPPPPPAFAGRAGSPYMPQVSQTGMGGIATSMASMSLHDSPLPRIKSVHGIIDYSMSAPPRPAPSAPTSAAPLLTAPLPTVSSLQDALSSVQSPSADPASQVSWIRDVLLLVNRANMTVEGTSSFTSSSLPLGPSLPSGPVHIADPPLQRLVDIAIPLLISLIPSSVEPGMILAPCIAEALFLRATLTASGAFPTFIPASSRVAFREFEVAARAGHPRAWFRLGRDYESFGDASHAFQCFEHGVAVHDESCTYRLGMARLLGQIGLKPDVPAAVELLHRAAVGASITCPQPAYVYALLLLNDFSQVSVPPELFMPYIPVGLTPAREARAQLQRAAFLHFVPAQQRLGHAYEFAEASFPFNPLMSVQYYSLASRQGEPEADMALSKWFLCGAEGANGFAKDEGLAYTFAEKAARKGLPSAEFAMGYYAEVGIGKPVDPRRAVEWYEKASAHGNSDAAARLVALTGPIAQVLSREQHNTITEDKLVRTRTQAKHRSEAIDFDLDAYAGPGREQNSQVQPGQLRGRPQQQMTKPRQASLPTPFPPEPPSVDQSLYQNNENQYYPQQNNSPRRHATAPPSSQHVRGGSLGLGPGAPTQPQQFADRPRYTLVDPGLANSPQPNGTAETGAYGRRAISTSAATHAGSFPPQRRQYSGNSLGELPRAQGEMRQPPSSFLQPPNVARIDTNGGGSGTRYNTFADMGIEGKKVEDKECRIM